LDAVRSLYKRFPERDLIISMCSFINPTRRKNRVIDIRSLLARFDNHYFDCDVVERSYHEYRNDELDYLFEDSYKDADETNGEKVDDVVGFWCDLYQNFDDYKELSKLAILIMTLTPDTCECERGVSAMNYVKNDLRTALTDTTLNACMAVALAERTMREFPFVRVLDYQ
jgi:hypothetical protein